MLKEKIKSNSKRKRTVKSNSKEVKLTHKKRKVKTSNFKNVDLLLEF